jgi:hypothetical protein
MCTAARSRWPPWPPGCWAWRSNQRRGDELRAQLHQRTRTVLDHLDKLGVATSNVSDFPIVELALADAEDLFPLLAVLGEVDDRFGSTAPPLRRSLGGLADFVRLLEFRT